jgi:hypothetical protein
MVIVEKLVSYFCKQEMPQTESPIGFEWKERQTEVKMIGRKVASDKKQAEKSSRQMGRHVESNRADEIPGIPQTIHDLLSVSSFWG